jgi:hypothetical protein
MLVRKLTIAGAALLALGAALPAAAASSDAVVSIRNDSLWAIQELYLSSTDEDEWGPDQLGDNVLNTGDSFRLTGVPCDSYDVRVVDEDGDECILEDVGLCAAEDVWVVTDEDLLGCQAATEE